MPKSSIIRRSGARYFFLRFFQERLALPAIEEAKEFKGFREEVVVPQEAGVMVDDLSYMGFSNSSRAIQEDMFLSFR